MISIARSYLLENPRLCDQIAVEVASDDGIEKEGVQQIQANDNGKREPPGA
jgi:hypothetical protein